MAGPGRACGLYLGPRGAIAQLGERLDRTQEVSGSNPLSSTCLGRLWLGREGAHRPTDCRGTPQARLDGVTQRTPTVRCEATLSKIDRWTVLRLPKNASARLPSRGQVAVNGRMNGVEFETVLEPDGSGGHWMRVDRKLQRTAGVTAGDATALDIAPADDWPEPAVPPDLEAALETAPQKIQDLWEAITPMARWEWVRWINATRNPDTRRRRVDVSISKMESGKRRPCCFNLAACTDADLSRNGSLLESSPGA